MVEFRPLDRPSFVGSVSFSTSVHVRSNKWYGEFVSLLDAKRNAEEKSSPRGLETVANKRSESAFA